MNWVCLPPIFQRTLFPALPGSGLFGPVRRSWLPGYTQRLDSPASVENRRWNQVSLVFMLRCLFHYRDTRHGPSHQQNGKNYSYSTRASKTILDNEASHGRTADFLRNTDVQGASDQCPLVRSYRQIFRLYPAETVILEHFRKILSTFDTKLKRNVEFYYQSDICCQWLTFCVQFTIKWTEIVIINLICND